MLTKEKLQELVQEIVPAPYTPVAGNPGGGWPILTDIVFAPSDEKIDYYVKKYAPGTKNLEGVKAICLNWGYLYRDAGMDGRDAAKSFRVLIRPSIKVTVLGLSFIILHEVGHVHWYTDKKARKEWKLGNSELFADMYAHDRLKELYGLMTAATTLSRYGSAEGFAAEIKKYEKDEQKRH